MKKLFTFIAVICLAMNASAQYQLTNPGFEGTWTSCTPYTGGSSTSVGQNPPNWCISHVAGYSLLGMWFGSTSVGECDEEGHTGNNACYIYNVEVLKNIIPGYVSLGTTWNTANTSGGNADGGAFGGVSFTGRPDAIEFYYKRTAADNSQPASVVAYLWKGETEQASVPVTVANSNPTTVNMKNRDRNILGMSYSKGGAVTYSQDFKLIASLKTNNEHVVKLTEEKSDWTKATFEFTYNSVDDAPTMINVVFSAMDYFVDRSNHKKDNTLTVDDVRFVYYSQLKSLTVNGVSIPGFDKDVYNYTVNSYYVEGTTSVDAVDNTKAGVATIAKNYDATTGKYTIVVTNQEGSVSHTYTIQFKTYDKGDVNKDGSVTIADVTALVNIILGKGGDDDMANVNGDEGITIADVTALVNIILGKN